MPEGAFYAWVKFETDQPAHIIAEQLLEKTGIVGVPGNSYGEYDTTCVRFSFATKIEILEKAVEMLKQWKNNIF